METTTPAFGWLSRELQEYLQLICDGVAKLVGFEAVLMSVADGDDMIRVAFAGPDLHRRDGDGALTRADVIGTRRPVAIVADILALGDVWGPFRYVPAERHLGGAEKHFYYVDAPVDKDGPGAWRDDDGLMAPIIDSGGTIRGLLSLDRPIDGMLPGPEKLAVLEKYADIAARSVLAAYERHNLEERARLAAEMRLLTRSAAQKRSLDAVLEEIAEPLTEALGLHSLWTQVFIGGSPEFSRQRGGERARLPASWLLQDAQTVASYLWQRQIAGVVATDHLVGFQSSALVEAARAYLADVGAESMLIVPLGAGPDCFGLLVMLRPSGSESWTTAEIEESAEIGRDLGRVLATAHAFEEEGRLAEELRATAHLRTMLLATVSHEIRNPLTAALVGIEVAQAAPTEERRTAALTNVERALRRLEKVVGDLQAGAQLDATEGHLDAARVDLAAIANEMHRMYRPLAREAGIDLELDAPEAEVPIWGDAEQLSRVVSNLIGNALTYTDAGGHVAVTLRSDPTGASLSVTDDGIGISPEDQEHIFESFYRSPDPQVRRKHGAGLGLALAHRIVSVHHGTIVVDSAPGRGSRFTVELPTGPRPKEDTHAPTVHEWRHGAGTFDNPAAVGSLFAVTPVTRPARERPSVSDSFFSMFTPREIARIAASGTRVNLPQGWSPIWEDTPADKAYIILSGTVSVRRDGDEIAQCGPGDIIGEAAILKGSLRTASIVALSPLELIHLSAEALTRLAVEMPSFGAALEKVAAERFADQ